MGFTTGYNFSNTTEGAKTFKTYALGEDSNYALVEDEAGATYIQNLTSPLDQSERMSIKAQNLSKVTTGNQPVYQNTTAYAGGVQFSVKDELIYRAVNDGSATSSTTSANICDIPVVVTLTVKHGRHASITPAVVEEAVARTVSMLYRNDGTSRIPSLQRLATKPEQD